MRHPLATWKLRNTLDTKSFEIDCEILRNSVEIYAKIYQKGLKIHPKSTKMLAQGALEGIFAEGRFPEHRKLAA